MHPESDSPAPAFGIALGGLCALATTLVLAWLLRHGDYGLDFTDEAFYLVWMSNPFSYQASITHFGFVYHPLFRLLGGEIEALRRANVLVTFSLAWCVTFAFLKAIAPQTRDRLPALLALSAGLSSASLVLFESWVQTPSYNSLAINAILLTTLGLLLSERSISSKSLLGWVSVGLGGWLAFLAKPSTAAALAVGVFVHLLVSRKLSVWMTVVAVATCSLLFLLTAYAIDGSPLRFIERLRRGVEFAELLGGGHTVHSILRIDSFPSGLASVGWGLPLIALVVAASWNIVSERKWSHRLALLFSSSFFLVTASVALGMFEGEAGLGPFPGQLFLGVMVSTVIVGFIAGGLPPARELTLAHGSLALLLVAAPHIYAFGTNGNYWSAGTSAGIFWLLAGVVFLGPVIRRRGTWAPLFPIVFATQAVTAALLQTGFVLPYRQPQPLWKNDSVVELGSAGSRLTLSQGFARYITEAQAAARDAGFVRATPMIDLTGQSPGVLYAIGAESIGQAWTIGGYPGSLGLARAALNLVPCEKIASAWVLFENEGPRSLPVELMVRLGARFPDDYVQVGAWVSAEGAGGFAAGRPQEMYKPNAVSKTREACRRMRDVRE